MYKNIDVSKKTVHKTIRNGLEIIVKKKNVENMEDTKLLNIYGICIQ